MKKKKLPKYELAGSFLPNPLISVKNNGSFANTTPNATPTALNSGGVLPQAQQFEKQNTYGIKEISPEFQALNAVAFGVGSIADTINEHKNRNQEKQKYIQSIQQPFNTRSGVQNDLPIYTKYGGYLPKYEVGGDPYGKKWAAVEVGDNNAMGSKLMVDLQSRTSIMGANGKPVWIYNAKDSNGRSTTIPEADIASQLGNPNNAAITNYGSDGKPAGVDSFYSASKQMPWGLSIPKHKFGGSLTADKAKAILQDGTIYGNKLTDKQKKYFGYVAGGGTPKAQYGIDETEGLPESQRENADLEAEKGEVFENGQGQIQKVSDNAPSHEEGGVLLNNVQRVLEDTSTTRKDKNSQALKLTPSAVEDLFGIKPKTSLSHSQALEFVNEYLQKQEKTAYSKIMQTAQFLDQNSNDKFASNSLDMNAKHIDSLPKKEDIFNILFDHQENIKNAMNIQPNQKAKCGGKYKVKAEIGLDNTNNPYDDITLKGADKTGGRTTTGANNNDYNFDAASLNQLAQHFGLRNDTNENFQSDLYDYASKHAPELIEQMWTKYGPTNNATTKDKHGFVDGNPKARTMFLVGKLADKPRDKGDIIPNDRYATPMVDKHIDPLTGTPNLPQPADNQRYTIGNRNQGASTFNEPLRATDFLPEEIGLLENDRIPTNMNQVQLHHVTPKLLNVLPALQAGQRDFNAAISKLPSASGVGMANAVNAFAQKYAIDDSTIGQYDNSNNQIENQSRYYNAGVDDKQSEMDAQARDSFERKQLGSMEAQRQQKMTYLDSIMTKINQNRALNRNGNLIMQTAPNLDQNGQYNGNQHYMVAGSATPQGNGSQFNIQKGTDPNGKSFDYFTDSKGKIHILNPKQVFK